MKLEQFLQEWKKFKFDTNEKNPNTKEGPPIDDDGQTLSGFEGSTFGNKRTKKGKNKKFRKDIVAKKHNSVIKITKDEFGEQK